MKKFPCNQHGFSLVELMAILVILAVCSALAFPGFGSSIRRNRFKRNSQEIMARLRGFKLRAISTGRAVTVSFTGHQLHVTVQGEDARTVQLDTDADVKIESEPEDLYFSPQGWARPAMIRLSQNNRTQVIRIDPLTARPYKLQRGTGQ